MVRPSTSFPCWKTWMPGTRPRMTIQSEHVEQSIQPAGFLGQHDRDAVADRISELGRTRDQLLLLGVIFQRTLGQRTDQDFKKLRIDGIGGRRGHRMLAPVQLFTAAASRRRSCSWRARSL